jgi:hypothetical protein
MKADVDKPDNPAWPRPNLQARIEQDPRLNCKVAYGGKNRSKRLKILVILR